MAFAVLSERRGIRSLWCSPRSRRSNPSSSRCVSNLASREHWIGTVLLATPPCPLTAASLLGLKATVLLLITLLIKARIQIKLAPDQQQSSSDRSRRSGFGLQSMQALSSRCSKPLRLNRRLKR
jgi:hypothetical protein